MTTRQESSLEASTNHRKNGERSYKMFTEEGKVLQRDRNHLQMDPDANHKQVKKEGTHKADVTMPESTTYSIPLKVCRVMLAPVDIKSKLVHSQGSRAQTMNPGGSSVAANELARDRKPPERLVCKIQSVWRIPSFRWIMTKCTKLSKDYETVKNCKYMYIAKMISTMKIVIVLKWNSHIIPFRERGMLSNMLIHIK